MSAVTRTSLLLGLRDYGNREAWEEFCDRYQPALLAFGRRLGLGEADAQDIAQETLLAFLDAYRHGKYERAKGRLGTWLMGIARHKVLHLHRRKHRQVQVADKTGETGFFDRLPDKEAIRQTWETEWRRETVRSCLRMLGGELEPSTLKAFELLTLKDWPTQRVAEELSLTANAVLKANRRVIARLRELHERVDPEW
jgi:RNA polymerase sigma-70 factor, ECF subfamily